MSKLFLKPFINFFVQGSLNAQNAVSIRVLRQILLRLCVATENILGEGGHISYLAFKNC